MGTVILAIVLLLAASSSTVSGDDKLHIFALPVGQGDATIIKCPDVNGNPNKQLAVIDMGSSSCTVGGCMDTEDDIRHFIGDHKVKRIFLTHPDKDHYNLITALTDKLDNDVSIHHSHDKECYKYARKAPLQALLDLNSVNQRVTTDRINEVDCNNPPTKTLCPNVGIRILTSQLGRCCGGPNEDSLVIQLVYGGTRALFVGDLEGHAVDELITCNNIPSQILRLAHHGSTNNNANSDEFLDKVDPTTAFSSSDPGHKSFRHPHCSILEWFEYAKDEVANNEHPYICDGDTYYAKLKYRLYQTTVMNKKRRSVRHYIIDFQVASNGATLQVLRKYKKGSAEPTIAELT